MAEINETEYKQLCNITIMFPVKNDEEGVEVKKKIAVIVADMTNVRLNFTLTSLPSKMV